MGLVLCGRLVTTSRSASDILRKFYMPNKTIFVARLDFDEEAHGVFERVFDGD